MDGKEKSELVKVIEETKSDAISSLANACVELDSCQEKIQRVHELIGRYGGYDGGHHKQWVLDQILQQTMTEEEYKAWLADYADGEDGPHTYAWDQGIAP